jgi:hypothetical protein
MIDTPGFEGTMPDSEMLERISVMLGTYVTPGLELPTQVGADCDRSMCLVRRHVQRSDDRWSNPRMHWERGGVRRGGGR